MVIHMALHSSLVGKNVALKVDLLESLFQSHVMHAEFRMVLRYIWAYLSFIYVSQLWGLGIELKSSYINRIIVP